MTPALCIVMVGDREDPMPMQKGCQSPGRVRIDCRLAHFPEGISQHRLLEEIGKINQNPAFHGILVMRPVPPRYGGRR